MKKKPSGDTRKIENDFTLLVSDETPKQREQREKKWAKEFEQQQREAKKRTEKIMRETKERTFLLQITVPVNEMEKFMRDMLPAAALNKIESRLHTLKHKLIFELPDFTKVNLAEYLQDEEMKKKMKPLFAKLWKELIQQQKNKI